MDFDDYRNKLKNRTFPKLVTMNIIMQYNLMIYCKKLATSVSTQTIRELSLTDESSPICVYLFCGTMDLSFKN